MTGRSLNHLILILTYIMKNGKILIKALLFLEQIEYKKFYL